MGTVGFYAGSFDPFTNGHLEIVKKASSCFDKVIIGIGYNTEKKQRIDKNKMKEAIEKSVQELGLDNVEIVLYTGLTAEKAKKYDADILIRGLRNGTDYQYEENIAQMNEKVYNMDTCYFRAGELGYLSSSLVMELYLNDKPIDEYVPKPIADLLQEIKKHDKITKK